jgi:hypothetical protein
MRIWQNFREPRTAFAMASALLALAFGALELRALFTDALAGVRSSDPILASAMAVGIVSLAGAVLALRRGNLVLLLVAWAFVLGNKFAAIMQFLNELSASSGRANFMLAVLSANVDLLIALVGAALAFASSFLRRRRASAS